MTALGRTIGIDAFKKREASEFPPNAQGNDQDLSGFFCFLSLEK